MGRTVLLVDDEWIIVSAIEQMLADLGCEVMTAGSGEELTHNPQIEV